jgi:hypothetical protein
MSRKTRARERGVPWITIGLAALFLAGGLGVLAFGTWLVDRPAARADADADRWASDYWRTPVAPQGALPPGHRPETAGLRVEDCAQCHAVQAQDWRASLHAAAMGPGVVAQFPAMDPEDQAQCRECHAPLGEQWPSLPRQAGWGGNPDNDAALMDQGVVCAACHLRGRVRHGPPLAPGRIAISHVYHGEPVRTAYFESSEFCRPCHQHAQGMMAPNGKSVENTYQEWLASPAAAEGRSCQSCHMPGRRHTWKGIHDPDMTRSGVTIAAGWQSGPPRQGEVARARLTVRNTGTGHAFPTYTTPAVHLRAAFVDAAGRAPAATPVAERTLQRRLDLTTSPWGEQFDTRLLPGAAATLQVDAPVPGWAAALRLRIEVEPDQFYADFFRERLEEQPGPEAAALYREALERATRSAYVLFEQTLPLR